MGRAREGVCKYQIEEAIKSAKFLTLHGFCYSCGFRESPYMCALLLLPAK